MIKKSVATQDGSAQLKSQTPLSITRSQATELLSGPSKSEKYLIRAAKSPDQKAIISHNSGGTVYHEPVRNNETIESVLSRISGSKTLTLYDKRPQDIPVVSREQANDLLEEAKAHTFLIRRINNRGAERILISVKGTSQVKHSLINEQEAVYEAVQRISNQEHGGEVLTEYIPPEKADTPKKPEGPKRKPICSIQ